MRFILAVYFLIVTSIFGTSDLLFQEIINGKNTYHPETGGIDLPIQNRENSPPVVTILLPSHDAVVTWDGQFRYEINISDPEDGESKYGEINPNEVLLEVKYRAGDNETIRDEEHRKNIITDQEQVGMSLIRKSGCFGCHRDKASMVGPSFSDIAQKYEPDRKTIEKLGNSIVEGSSDNWGNIAMPPHDQFSHSEAMQMARFILEQGRDHHRWIYPGLKGMVRTLKKPAGETKGTLILTASYTDHGVNGDSLSRKRGSHSIVLQLR